MRILVEPSAHHLLNAGDAAMLQVACERLVERWPDAAVGVLTDSPERLAKLCAGIVPVPAVGRRLWFEAPYLSAALHDRLPAGAAARLRAAERTLRHRAPGAAAATIRGRLRAKRESSAELDAFVDWASDADLVLVSGAGLLTDAFAPRAVSVCELLLGARGRGAATAMVGQGVSRLGDAPLVAAARRTLPGVDLIGLRETRTGGPVLRELGVPDERVVATGDDAIELAHRLRGGPVDGVGLALRRARYADVGQGDAARLAEVVREVAQRWGVPVVPVPISAVPHEADAEVIAEALGGGPAVELEPGSPRAAIEQAGRCRVVVAGSYHAAVFALAQGIPAIGLAGAEYYVEKFQGLAEQFGGHCPVVRVGVPDSGARLEAALESVAAEAHRAALLEAAERQIEAGRNAYGRLADIAETAGARRAGAPRTRTRAASARRRLRHALEPRLGFNCADQDDRSWDERAHAAVRLLARELAARPPAPGPLAIADVGCGNQRLRGALEEGLRQPIRYRGYDLHPQSPAVARLDVEQGLPRGPWDAVFCLGLLEYLHDLGALARGLRETASMAVVSYVVADGSERMTPAERESRGWRTHLTRGELERCFDGAGLRAVDAVVTNRGRTVVWLWRAPAAAGSRP